MNRLLAASSIFVGLALPAMAAELKVMASIKPVHALVASVMGETGAPGLIVDGAGSPHTYSLRPKDAEALQGSNVIFWVGHELEAFLEKPIEALPKDAKVVSLMEAKGVEHLAVREGDGFEAHEEHGEGDNHGHGEEDAHIWLDPANAIAMVDAIAAALSEADGAHAETYAANAKATKDRLSRLQDEIVSATAPLKEKRYIVFHDAYQYFEKRFGLSASGAISIHPENPPGAKGIRDIQQRIADAKVQCVFSEPQFDNKLVNLVIEGTDVKTGVMDPIGASLQPGPMFYDELLRGLVASMKGCLGT